MENWNRYFQSEYFPYLMSGYPTGFPEATRTNAMGTEVFVPYARLDVKKRKKHRRK